MNRLMTLLVVLLALSAVAGCSTDSGGVGESQSALAAPPIAESNEPDIPAQAESLDDRWGIKIERASLSAGGYMVDFRYRVLDKDKAAPILDRAIKPYLIDQATGARFAVPTPPKVGALRAGGKIREGAIYYIFFANPGRYVKAGNKVTVVVGDFEARDVLIQ